MNPLLAGHGPDRLPRRRPGRQRDHRGGRPRATCSASSTATTSTSCACTAASWSSPARRRTRLGRARCRPATDTSRSPREPTVRVSRGLRARLLRQRAGPRRAGVGGARRRWSPASSACSRCMRGQSFAGRRARRHRHDRRLRRLPGRGQPAVGLRRGTACSRPAVMEHDRRPAHARPGPGHRHRARRRPRPRRAVPLPRTTDVTSTTGATSRSCSARCSRSPARQSRSSSPCSACPPWSSSPCSTGRCC